jgi:exodeoxyribonuclease-1
VYTSGKYAAEYEKTTIAVSMGDNPDRQGILVYDLRHDPTPFLKMSPVELVEAWKYTKDPDALRLPVKTLRFNRCPAVAPIGVLNEENKKRLAIDEDEISRHQKLLSNDFYKKIVEALELMNRQRADQATLLTDVKDVDGLLYEQFLQDQDRDLCRKVMASNPDELSAFASRFQDSRMKQLMPLYKARNFPKHLTDEERAAWETFRTDRLRQQLPNFIKRLQELGQSSGLTGEKEYLLQELQLYAESIVPEALVA